MSEDTHAQTAAKKVAIVILISLAREAENKTSEELETEIHKALEKGLARIPWLVMEKVIVIEEKYTGARNVTKKGERNYAIF